MRGILWETLFLGSILASAAIAQQPSEQANPGEILVIGNRDLDKQVNDFVRALNSSRFARAAQPFRMESLPRRHRPSAGTKGRQ